MSVLNPLPAPAAHTPPAGPLLVFPGQGSQRPAMAAHLLHNFPRQTRPVLAWVDEVLGFPLADLCVSGEVAELARTEIAQPAILATSLATLEVLRDRGVNAAAVAGHSLGEYTALVASGVITAESALRLVRRRGELMASVGATTPGAMAAIVGLGSARVEELCRSSTGKGVVEVANYNEPQQTVISGHREAVAEVIRSAEEAGADRTAYLDVTAPFHCGLMHTIEAEFAQMLDRHDFSPPHTPVISSVSGAHIGSGEEARTLLGRQLAAPVLWTYVLETAGVEFTAQIEVGPGRVLSGLANRSGLGLTARSTNDARRLAAVLPSD